MKSIIGVLVLNFSNLMDVSKIKEYLRKANVVQLMYHVVWSKQGYFRVTEY